jgi:hypothetical protein
MLTARHDIIKELLIVAAVTRRFVRGRYRQRYQTWTQTCAGGEVKKEVEGRLLHSHCRRECYLHSNYGPVITHAHSTIPVSVDSTKSTAHSAENGQVWKDGL